MQDNIDFCAIRVKRQLGLYQFFGTLYRRFDVQVNIASFTPIVNSENRTTRHAPVRQSIKRRCHRWLVFRLVLGADFILSIKLSGLLFYYEALDLPATAKTIETQNPFNLRCLIGQDCTDRAYKPKTRNSVHGRERCQTRSNSSRSGR